MIIRGSRVTLCPARVDERRMIYDWLARSDLTSSMLGPPNFPENPVPTWEEYCADYTPELFRETPSARGQSLIVEVSGEAVGHVSYDRLDEGRGLAELDIWMRSAGDCGHGYGSDALAALVRHLRERPDVREMIIRPSARNRRAIAAYKKAGFAIVPMSDETQAARYGVGEYDDTLVMRAGVHSAT